MKIEQIELNNLTKAYRDGKDTKKAVDELSFSVEEGKIFGLVGPNGAGKTTTIKMIIGLLKPDSGIINIFGKDNRHIETKKWMGYLPEDPIYLNYLNGKEFLEYMGALSGLNAQDLKNEINQITIKVGLEDNIKRKITTYSKGMIQRLFLAQALLGNPRLVVLDEPTTGLDPLGIIDFRNILYDLKKQGRTIIMCSHYLSELEKVCDTVGFLKQGKIQHTFDMQNKQESLEDLFLKHVHAGDQQ
ncbi:MAG: ABC transporter ATP-binding protein [Candidatus Omnitrophota bacterium]